MAAADVVILLMSYSNQTDAIENEMVVDELATQLKESISRIFETERMAILEDHYKVLNLAAMRDNCKILRILLASLPPLSRLDVLTKQGNNPLHVAAFNGNLNSCKVILLQLDAGQRLMLMEKTDDHDGFPKTAADFAKNEGFYDVVEALQRCKATAMDDIERENENLKLIESELMKEMKANNLVEENLRLKRKVEVLERNRNISRKPNTDTGRRPVSVITPQIKYAGMNRYRSQVRSPHA